VTSRKTVVVVVVLAFVLVAAATTTYLVLVPTPSKPPSTSPGPPPTPALCPTEGGAGSSGNWTTYHQTNNRSGAQAGAPITSVQPLWPSTTGLDGQVYAEPLVCGDSVYVATEDDSVYAINASTGAVEWHTHLGTPEPGSALPCGDIDPSGITGTPVIDTATGTLYAVAFLNTGQHVLFGLNVVNGSVRSQVVVDPAGATPTVEQQRGALALANGMVYVPYGGLDGDCGPYHGWVVGVPTNGSTTLLSYQVPTQREGGIWGTGGVVVAPNGTLYVSTGNGASDTTFDFGDSVIALAPDLTELGYFAPANWVELNEHDTDLGSVAPTLLANGDIFQIGKEGVGDLLSASHLGGVGGQLYNESVCGGAYGGTAHVGLTVYVPCTDGVVAVVVSGSAFTVGWRSAPMDAGSPVVTGNVVWAVDLDTSDLMGLNATTGATLYTFPLGSADHFISPTAAPGSLYVAGGDQLFAFALA
jgi:polyvinyl alcohol dehydrogenase (cytochrome)